MAELPGWTAEAAGGASNCDTIIARMVPRLRHNARMEKVKAIRIHATGGPERLVLDDVEVGEPGPGGIRIRHHASGLNFIDVYHRTGLYQLPLPHALGMEGA